MTPCPNLLLTIIITTIFVLTTPLVLLLPYLSSSYFSNQYAAAAHSSLGLKQTTEQRTIQICCSWGQQIADGILTYRIIGDGGNPKVVKLVHQAIDDWNSKVPNIKLQEITTDNNTPNADVKYRFSIDMASLKSSRMAWRTIAIQEQLEGNMADWMEKVSDEQYRITKINYKNLVIMKSNNFKGKVAFVTGAASGIGRAAAIAFALEGASVVVADISEQGSHETTNIIKVNFIFLCRLDDEDKG